jgi:hypothetical protein
LLHAEITFAEHELPNLENDEEGRSGEQGEHSPSTRVRAD